MPRVRFLANFDFKPHPNVTQAFLAGQEVLVTTECARAAIDKGRAEAITETPADTPRRRKVKSNGGE